MVNDNFIFDMENESFQISLCGQIFLKIGSLNGRESSDNILIVGFNQTSEHHPAVNAVLVHGA